MENLEILKKSIEKAMSSGYDKKLIVEDQGYSEPTILSENRGSSYSIADILFSHDFAKAFWGEEFPEEIDKNEDTKYWGDYEFAYKGNYWQWNLQQMVLEEDPIKYLEQFI